MGADAVMRRRCGRRAEGGFTLVELLVTMVIALVLLAGLLYSFQSQYGQYKYQNRRVDAVQDLEFVSRFIADDIRGALVLGGVPQVTITNASGVTTDLKITAWEPDASFWGAAPNDAASNQYRAIRHYAFDAANEVLKYDRNTNDGNDSPQPILENVTDFRIFKDTPGVAPTGFAGAPVGLPQARVLDSQGNPHWVSGYTVLVEVAVEGGYKGASFTNARGVDVRTLTDKRKRVWRYVQVHPQAAGD